MKVDNLSTNLAKDVHNKKKNKITIGFNGLRPKEWAKLSRSVWNDVSSPRKEYHLEHGATFSEALAERVIRMYTKIHDKVLDPFLGTGTTLVAAKRLNRIGIGIELYEKFVNIAKKIVSQQTLLSIKNEKLFPEKISNNVAYDDGVVAIIKDDARNLLNYIEKDSIQLMLTSPPYANFVYKAIEDRAKTHKKSLLVLENKSVVKPYGDDPRDFGNLQYEDFLEEIKKLMKKLFVVTKPGGYNVWVVKDARDPKNGRPYIPLHADLGRIAEEVGFKWHDLIIWDQNEQRKLVLLGYPSVFYVNINHSFLVILRKPLNNR